MSKLTADIKTYWNVAGGNYLIKNELPDPNIKLSVYVTGDPASNLPCKRVPILSLIDGKMVVTGHRTTEELTDESKEFLAKEIGLREQANVAAEATIRHGLGRAILAATHVLLNNGYSVTKSGTLEKEVLLKEEISKIEVKHENDLRQTT